MCDEDTNATTNDSEKGQSDKKLTLPRLFSESYYANLMKVQEENPIISRTFISLQMMFFYFVEGWITTYHKQFDELETAILKLADDLVNEKEFSESEREELKRNLRRTFEQHKSISERHSDLIWNTIERVQRLEDQDEVDPQ